MRGDSGGKGRQILAADSSPLAHTMKRPMTGSTTTSRLPPVARRVGGSQEPPPDVASHSLACRATGESVRLNGNAAKPIFSPRTSGCRGSREPAASGSRAGGRRWRQSARTASSKSVRHGVRAERARQPLGDRESRGRESEAYSGNSGLSPTFSGERPVGTGSPSTRSRTRKSRDNLRIYADPRDTQHRRLSLLLRAPGSASERNASPNRTRTWTLVVNTNRTAPPDRSRNHLLAFVPTNQQPSPSTRPGSSPGSGCGRGEHGEGKAGRSPCARRSGPEPAHTKDSKHTPCSNPKMTSALTHTPCSNPKMPSAPTHTLVSRTERSVRSKAQAGIKD
jgi:hypothetical protein